MRLPICRTIALLVLMISVSAEVAEASKTAKPIIGESEQVYTLAPENKEIRGIAFDEVSPKAPRLLVLDQTGKVFVYQVPKDQKGKNDELKLLETISLPVDADGYCLTRPRGLAYVREGKHDVLYFMNWDDSLHLADRHASVISQLWRFDLDAKKAVYVDLSRYTNRFGDREPFDLTLLDGDFLISFNPLEYPSISTRMQHGIVRLRWSAPYDKDPEFIRHMPDSGIAPSHGLASMKFEGAKYLWATIGNRDVYCADGPTGRGLFWFDRPRTSPRGSCYGLCFGDDSLWVSENVPGPSRVHRVNVTKNIDAPLVGPRVLRHLIMSIETRPEEEETPHAGTVTHNFSRPYGNRQMPNQGIWPKTEKIFCVTKVDNATIKPFTYDPAGDRSSRQYMRSVVFGDAPAQFYKSQYEIDMWTRPYKKFIYPHRVDNDTSKLKGTNYLEDDPELYNLKSDRETYVAFIERIKKHIEKKYGVAADMENPYWAARNTIEYIQDNYYYPNPSKRKSATVDYSRNHYDANPGNLKIELSERPYDKMQIIACSGTSVMVAGTMRHLGIPARWLGTGTPYSPGNWDKNHNGLLDEGESAVCTNGHRYNNVWLGSRYGWICFDATPSKPDMNDYDQPPPLQSQWRFMQRCAAGTREPNRIVFNIGSKLFRPLYRDFEYDEKRAVINACGGDQRYNLKARFEKNDLWKGSGERIAVANLCYITDIKLSGPQEKTKITWDLKGDWQLDRSAKLTVALERVYSPNRRPRQVAVLAEAVPYNKRSVVVDLSGHQGKSYQIIIRKVGDPDTGGVSETFDLP